MNAEGSTVVTPITCHCGQPSQYNGYSGGAVLYVCPAGHKTWDYTVGGR